MTTLDQPEVPPEPKRIMVCRTCKSERVVRDAWAEWNVERQEWVLNNVFDYAFCQTCEGETKIEEKPAPR